jgi:hypothetical protein
MNKTTNLENAINAINGKINEILKIHHEIKSGYQLLLLFYLIRLNEAVKSILILLNNQLYEDAKVLCRSIFEMAINIEYIKDDKIGGVERISNTAQNELRKIEDELSNSQTPKVANILPSINERAKSIMKGSPAYTASYRILCQSAHITLDRMKHYLGYDEKQQKIIKVSPNIEAKKSICNAMAIVIDKILSEVLDEFNLKQKYLADYMAFRHYVNEGFENQ